MLAQTTATTMNTSEDMRIRVKLRCSLEHPYFPLVRTRRGQQANCMKGEDDDRINITDKHLDLGKGIRVGIVGSLLIGDVLAGVGDVGMLPGDLGELGDSLITIEQGCGLFESLVLGLNYE